MTKLDKLRKIRDAALQAYDNVAHNSAEFFDVGQAYQNAEDDYQAAKWEQVND